MSRLTWFTAGAVTGVYVLVKARSTARNFTPDGIAARAAALSVGFRAFASNVATGMSEREAELRERAAGPSLPAAVPPMIEGPAAPSSHPSPTVEEPADGHR